MSDSTLERPPCNLCGSTAFRVRIPARRVQAAPAAHDDLARRFSSSSDERLSHQLVECSVCSLQYVSPRLRKEEVLDGYAAGSDQAFVSQVHGREITFERSLDLIAARWPHPPGRLLDIGTGSGAFPHVAAGRGWQVEACEPNRWLCDWARSHYGLAVRQGTVFDQHYPAMSFDVVSLWDVLEHTTDPKAEISEARRLLREGGLLVVNYPDIGSWIARVMGRRWVFLLDVHLYYFTRGTIRRLLEDVGFDVLHISPHIQRLGMGYVLRRATPYVGAPARAAGWLASRLGLAGLQMPYWMGQTLVIARRANRTQAPAGE